MSLQVSSKQEVHKLLHTLREQNLNIALVESVTGGLIVKTMIDFPTFGKYIYGSYVAYSNTFKSIHFDLDTDPYSKKGVEDLARKTRYISNADCILAVTGHAGPSDNKLGIIYMSVITSNGAKTVIINLRQRYPIAVNMVAEKYLSMGYTNDNIIDEQGIKILTKLRKAIRHAAMKEVICITRKYIST
jgi:nicotinamide-nucleotide amidase